MRNTNKSPHPRANLKGQRHLPFEIWAGYLRRSWRARHSFRCGGRYSERMPARIAPIHAHGKCGRHCNLAAGRQMSLLALLCTTFGLSASPALCIPSESFWLFRIFRGTAQQARRLYPPLSRRARKVRRGMSGRVVRRRPVFGRLVISGAERRKVSRRLATGPADLSQRGVSAGFRKADLLALRRANGRDSGEPSAHGPARRGVLLCLLACTSKKVVRPPGRVPPCLLRAQ